MKSIDRGLNYLDSHNQKSNQSNSTGKVILTKASDVIPKPITWLWDQWLPLGKLTILGGAGGTGKTTLALGLATTITTGGKFPDTSMYLGKGNILIWSSEDDPDDVLVPRLMAMGADLTRVHFISGMSCESDRFAFDPSIHIGALCEKVNEIGRVSLLIIDPIVSAVAKDMNQANDVRRSLQPIVDFAARYQCAVIGISHVGKGTQGKDPTERILGSQAFTAFARMVWVTASNKETGERVLVRSKSNISKLDGGFSYVIEQTEIGQGISTSRVVWKESVFGHAAEILRDFESIEDSKVDSEVKEAERYLKDLLENESLPAKQVKNDSKEAGFSYATIRRASENIRIKKRKSGMNGGWYWSLPTERQNAEDAQNMPKMPIQKSEHLRGNLSTFNIQEVEINGGYYEQ